MLYINSLLLFFNSCHGVWLLPVGSPRGVGSSLGSLRKMPKWVLLPALWPLGTGLQPVAKRTPCARRAACANW